jgi:hypothetical protein
MALFTQAVEQEDAALSPEHVSKTATAKKLDSLFSDLQGHESEHDSDGDITMEVDPPHGTATASHGLVAARARSAAALKAAAKKVADETVDLLSPDKNTLTQAQLDERAREKARDHLAQADALAAKEAAATAQAEVAAEEAKQASEVAAAAFRSAELAAKAKAAAEAGSAAEAEAASAAAAEAEAAAAAEAEAAVAAEAEAAAEADTAAEAEADAAAEAEAEALLAEANANAKGKNKFKYTPTKDKQTRSQRNKTSNNVSLPPSLTQRLLSPPLTYSTVCLDTLKQLQARETELDISLHLGPKPNSKQRRSMLQQIRWVHIHIFNIVKASKVPRSTWNIGLRSATRTIYEYQVDEKVAP